MIYVCLFLNHTVMDKPIFTKFFIQIVPISEIIMGYVGIQMASNSFIYAMLKIDLIAGPQNWNYCSNLLD